MEVKVMKVDMMPRRGPGRPKKGYSSIDKFDVKLNGIIHQFNRVIQDINGINNRHLDSSNSNLSYLQSIDKDTSDIKDSVVHLKHREQSLTANISTLMSETRDLNANFKRLEGMVLESTKVFSSYGDSFESYTKIHIEDDLKMVGMIHEIIQNIERYKNILLGVFWICVSTLAFVIVAFILDRL